MSTTQSYTVTGMTCDHCARSVRSEVGAVEGVADVEVHLASGRLSVTTTHPVTLARLSEAVAEAGYTLAP